ncbi:phosphotransferase [Streptomyces sp. SID5474]|nr:phosphotransferase [Embleya scabrispora]MYS79100.1 phosphotransferase [Streptomyces sp. SID5474]
MAHRRPHSRTAGGQSGRSGGRLHGLSTGAPRRDRRDRARLPAQHARRRQDARGDPRRPEDRNPPLIPDRAPRTALPPPSGRSSSRPTHRGPGFWEDALRAAAWDGPPVWLHADPMPGNLPVDGGGRLTSVIDFGCMGVGDPACDLFPAWNLLPTEARQVFREALGVDDATWRRGRGRALSQAVIALPYYRTTNPVMARNARHVIRTILDIKFA